MTDISIDTEENDVADIIDIMPKTSTRFADVLTKMLDLPFALLGTLLVIVITYVFADGMMVLEAPLWLAAGSVLALAVGFNLLLVRYFSERWHRRYGRQRLSFPRQLFVASNPIGALVLIPTLLLAVPAPMSAALGWIADHGSATSFTTNSDGLVLSKDIGPSAGREFARYLHQTKASNRPLHMMMESSGGSTVGGSDFISVMRSVQQDRPATATIPPFITCASECAEIFMASAERVIDRSGWIMFHDSDAYGAYLEDPGTFARFFSRLQWGEGRLLQRLTNRDDILFTHDNPALAAFFRTHHVFDRPWYEPSKCLFLNGTDLQKLGKIAGFDVTVTDLLRRQVSFDAGDVCSKIGILTLEDILPETPS